LDFQNGDADQETGWPVFRDWLAGLHRLRAGLFGNNGKVWMFDNEIDWVMRI
jgi:hypothetical protein